jgi:hypothetical protein
VFENTTFSYAKKLGSSATIITETLSKKLHGFIQRIVRHVARGLGAIRKNGAPPEIEKNLWSQKKVIVPFSRSLP